MRSKLHECQRVNPPGIRITSNISDTTNSTLLRHLGCIIMISLEQFVAERCCLPHHVSCTSFSS